MAKILDAVGEFERLGRNVRDLLQVVAFTGLLSLSTACTKSVDLIKLQQVCKSQICFNLIFADFLQVVETTYFKLADKMS